METKRNSCPRDCYGKLFKAITVRTHFRRTIRRNSDHHQDSMHMPTNPSPNPLVKTHHSAKHTKPIESAQQHKATKNGEAVEGVPIKFDESGLPSATPHATVQKRRKEPISQLAQEKNVATMHKAEIAAQDEQKYKQNGDNNTPSPIHATVGYGLQGVLETNGKIEPPRVSGIESNKVGANMDDQFTDYINRTGIKIRTTSSVNGKNNPSASANDDNKDHFSDYINRAKNKMLRTMSRFVGGRIDSMK